MQPRVISASMLIKKLLKLLDLTYMYSMLLDENIFFKNNGGYD